MATYAKANKKVRVMQCHASLIPQYMESRWYKGKGIGKYNQRIEELPTNMFKSNLGKRVFIDKTTPSSRVVQI